LVDLVNHVGAEKLVPVEPARADEARDPTNVFPRRVLAIFSSCAEFVEPKKRKPGPHTWVELEVLVWI
jgi:hypothetical protein